MIFIPPGLLHTAWCLSSDSCCSFLLLFITVPFSALSPSTSFCPPSSLPSPSYLPLCVTLSVHWVCALNDGAAEAACMVAKTEAVLLSCCLSVSHTQPQTEWLLFKEQSCTCLFKKKKSIREMGREGKWRSEERDQRRKMKGGTYRWIDERDRSRRMRRKGMMSSFNPVPLPSPLSCFLPRFFFLLFCVALQQDYI